MGRTQYSYDYPEVRPPHPQTQYPVEAQTVNDHADSRFSWMETPTEEHGTQRTRTAKRQSTVPPLPIVPEHLRPEFQRQQSVTQELQGPPRHTSPIPQQPVQHQMYTYPHPYQQQQQYHHHQDAVLFTQPSQIPQPPDPELTPQAETSERDERHVDQPQRPDLVKETPDHPHYHSPIMPDSNPLTPTSPRHKNINGCPQNTNMPVVPPTPSHYNFNNYAPVPQPTTGGVWAHSLCSCSEPSICMTGLFCPCVIYGRTQHKLHLRSKREDPTNMLGYQPTNTSCIVWAVVCGVNGILSGIQKTRIRRAYEMGDGAGSVFNDCLEGCCCCCCVLARNAKEVKHREEEGRKVLNEQGYRPQGGMSYTMPSR